MKKSIIKLKPKKEDSLKRFHPWIFSGAIAELPKNLEEGDVVDIYSSSNEYLATGHYQIGSIAIRVLSFKNEPIDVDFFTNRLSEAFNLRKSLGLVRDDNNAFRLVHGEGDSLPGLIVDIYGKTAVIQSHSVGMHKSQDLIVEALKKVLLSYGLKNVFYKSEGTLPYKFDMENVDRYIFGGDSVDEKALENDLSFHIDWLKGQKTGFFLDQRENRTLLGKYAFDRKVLNMFCYTGGFSVYALRGNAKVVHSVDSSAKAISLTEENVKLNFGNDNRHKAYVEDAFKFLKNLPQSEYDLIILDPPAFAKHRGAVNNALQGYKRLNLAAIEKIKKGGIIFTFSCSQVISKELFRLAVFSAAAISGRKVSILHQLTQPADHPINIYHPEGEYLKGLVICVD